jgi:hypothetical protein
VKLPLPLLRVLSFLLLLLQTGAIDRALDSQDEAGTAAGGAAAAGKKKKKGFFAKLFS